MLTACDVKDPIYDTDHPDHGKITLTTDWSNIGSGLIAPASYTVKVGDYSTTVSGATNTIDNLFLPGTYTAYVYNTADNISVSGTTATANYAAGTLGWFFTSKLTETVEADTDHEFTAMMAQQVRELTLVLTPSGDAADIVSTVTGTLSGVAGTLDFDSDAHGSATTAALTFTKITSGADAGKWTATVRLLGIAGSSQELNIAITYTDAQLGVQHLDPADLTVQLTGFNADKKTPLALGAGMETLTAIGGFTTTLTDWTTTTVSGNAEMD